MFYSGLSVTWSIPFCHSDAPIPPTDSFYGVGASEGHHVPPDGHLGDVELTRQILICILSPQAKYLQKTLPTLGWPHILTASPLWTSHMIGGNVFRR